MSKKKKTDQTEKKNEPTALDRLLGALGRLIPREQRQQILGVCLLGLALFTFVSLLPVSWFGGMGETVCTVGGTLGDSLHALIGYSAFLVPFLLLFLGLHIGEWIAEDWTVSLSCLTAGLIVLLPVFIYVWLKDPSAGTGWFGESLGEPLHHFMGPTGATIVTGIGLVILSIGTLAWNPLISVK